VALRPCHLHEKVSEGKRKESWKLKNFTMQKFLKKKSSENPLKETKILQDIIITLL
jgi:hypothetical protein